MPATSNTASYSLTTTRFASYFIHNYQKHLIEHAAACRHIFYLGNILPVFHYQPNLGVFINPSSERLKNDPFHLE